MAKEVSGQKIIEVFESFSPKNLAVEGDKIGLQIGTLSKPVKRVMVTLDVMENVVDEAIEKKVDLIIAHHPPIFRPLKTVTTDGATGRIVEKCLKHDIAVYAAHTNLDVTKGGVNDLLADALGIKDTTVLAPTGEEALKKLVVFVPKSHADEVRHALGTSGGGHIGNYSHCTFNTEGKGTFLPLEGTDPYVGTKGELHEEEEVRIETVFKASDEKNIIRAMKKTHPYEEVAYDVYDLSQKGEEYGLGRIGKLEEETTLREFAERVKHIFGVSGLRVVGNLQDKVRKVAVLGGDGNKYMYTAKFKGADVYVTGDLYFHVAQDAMNVGLNVIDPGHHVEQIMKKGVTDKLTALFKDENILCEVFPSEEDTNPFQFM
ncbi:Nif3-like dinuclear metal center hexameric protein [Priestia endophytica]|uniref:Nif3-like dinuclear metal center hexameric protein n=1 Tax=Priestia endophytica TaxID=135735 RepID=UPI002E1DEC79|nr:Nif3-like dinuclear metal center hexameric protein [Priestia endophytica]MED4070595.1 Nif3-like dinuclear metal center hexameric protein [Priestia endophytica]